MARDEAEVGLVGRRQWEVVAAERVVREVTDHRAGLESEQHRRQHRQQAGDGIGAAELAGVDAGLDLLLERLAEVAGQRLQHRPQRREVQLGPLAGADDPHRGGQAGGETGELGHMGLRGPGELAELGRRGRVGRDLGGVLERHRAGHLAGYLPVDRSRRRSIPMSG